MPAAAPKPAELRMLRPRDHQECFATWNASAGAHDRHSGRAPARQPEESLQPSQHPRLTWNARADEGTGGCSEKTYVCSECWWALMTSQAGQADHARLWMQQGCSREADAVHLFLVWSSPLKSKLAVQRFHIKDLSFSQIKANQYARMLAASSTGAQHCSDVQHRTAPFKCYHPTNAR